MKFLCINLKRDRFRYDRFINRMKKVKNENEIVRIDAIFGKSVSEDDKKTMMTLYSKSVLDNPNDRQTHEHFNTLGALGCYLSHVKAWKHMLDNNIQEAVIFEDDARVLEDEFSAYFTDIITDLRENGADLCFLGYINRSVPDVYDEHLYEPVMEFEAHSYYLTLKGATILLKHCFPIELHVDLFLSIMSMYYLRGFLSRKRMFIQSKETQSYTYIDCPRCGYYKL